MASLRELLEKQKNDKAAAAKAEAPAKAQGTVVNGNGAAPPVKTGGFMSRLGVANAPAPAVLAPTTTFKMPTPAEVKIALVPDLKPLPAPEPLKRGLSEDGVAELKKNLNYLAENIDQKELVGQVVRVIAVQLKENPQFSSHMTNADFNLLVRGLRRSFNVAARRKVEGQEKKSVRHAEVNELEQMMKDAGVNFNL